MCSQQVAFKLPGKTFGRNAARVAHTGANAGAAQTRRGAALLPWLPAFLDAAAISTASSTQIRCPMAMERRLAAVLIADVVD